jgi:4-hydroxy-tetrahydrodipicolinate synthase
MTLNNTADLRGVLTALSTPFDADENIDVDLLKKVVDRSIDIGVDGVVAGGSTGEFAMMTDSEREQLVDTVAGHTGGRVPVIAQTGATTTRHAIRFSKAAERSGADVLMLVTPYYEPLTLTETLDYIREVASNVELPVMLYNIPGATGVNLAADDAGALADEFENIRYIKDSSADWEQALQLIHHHGDRLGTFIGWDSYIYSAMVEGAAGVMAGAANVVPTEIVEVVRLIDAGKLAEALAGWNKVYPVIDTMITQDSFISAVKSGLRHRGLPVGVPRRPMADVSAEADAAIGAAVARLATA